MHILARTWISEISKTQSMLADIPLAATGGAFERPSGENCVNKRRKMSTLRT